MAKAIAPECEIEIVGIRPGEKLHESMITEDDARHTKEFDTYYIIQPEFPWWSEEYTTAGKPLNEGFKYTSDRNTEWLSMRNCVI